MNTSRSTTKNTGIRFRIKELRYSTRSSHPRFTCFSSIPINSGMLYMGRNSVRFAFCHRYYSFLSSVMSTGRRGIEFICQQRGSHRVIDVGLMVADLQQEVSRIRMEINTNQTKSLNFTGPIWINCHSIEGVDPFVYLHINALTKSGNDDTSKPTSNWGYFIPMSSLRCYMNAAYGK